MSIESSAKITEKVWIEISRDAITQNVKNIRRIVGSGVSLLAVVKADGYGLGLQEISRVLWESGVDAFGVSNLQEGIDLRRNFPKVPIIILGPSFLDNVEEVLEWDLIPIVSSLELFRKLNETASLKGKRAKVHLMVDTGMGRIGVWYEKGEEFFKELLRMESVKIEGIASHFSSSDKQDLDFSKKQLGRFQDFLFRWNVMGFESPLRHIANSGAMMRLPESFFDMVRIGILLYGISPSHWVPRNEFQAAISWKTRIAFIKEVEPGRTISYESTFVVARKTKIATLPVGYAHGYDRSLSNIGEVLIRGRRSPVVGKVTMDQIMVDLGPESQAKVGDEAVLIGVQGQEEVTMEEMAQKASTIPYELMCRLKVKKIYI
jgi:alanine racemase